MCNYTTAVTVYIVEIMQQKASIIIFYLKMYKSKSNHEMTLKLYYINIIIAEILR